MICSRQAQFAWQEGRFADRPAHTTAATERSGLATTTRNESLRAIRHAQRTTPQDVLDERADATAISIEERVGDDVTLNAVLHAFAQLSPEDQQLMRLLCTVPPLDYQTIAEMLGRPIGSIGPTRARCLARLRKLLPPGIDPKEAL